MTAALPPVIELAGVQKTYRSGGARGVGFRALNGVDLTIAAGEMVAVTGPSGSGKTTIINLIAGIDRPTEGTVTVGGSRLDQMTEEQLAVWRGRTVGIVFQFFQLMPTLTATENATLPLDLARLGPSRGRKAVASRHLATVGLGDRGDRLPLELSGGEQQRVAIARAMACAPPILLGDEPTGNLDTVLALEMFELLKGLNDKGTTVVYVTHDQALAQQASRIVSVRDGLIVGDTGRAAMSTLARKAWGDLARHRARTLLAVFTLSIAIASLGFIAVPSLLNAAMNRQVADSHLYDVGIETSTLDLTPAQLTALGRLPGVAAVSPVVGYTAKATSAAGAQNVAIAGTELASAPVNTVPLLSGRLPGPGEVLADAANGRATGYAVPVGATIDVRAASGAIVPLRVSGTGINLAATPGANGSTTPVFYATTATVESLRGVRGYQYLGFRLTDDSTAAQNQVITEVRAYLTRLAGTDPITALPMVRAPGQWPGQSAFAKIMTLLYIITALAFLSALFLIVATMNTLIAEQAGEIAILKTLGGRRRQIGGIILRTAAMLGAGGALVGTIIGIVIAYLLTGYFAEKFVDVSFGFQVAVGVVVASLLVGPALAVAASLLALRRALRRSVAETLADKGTSGYGSGRLDRLVARSGVLSSAGVPGSVRMGVRNVLRQKRRSTAAIAQVAVAAGLAIAFLALGQSITAVISQTIGQLRFSFSVGMAGSGARPFGSQAVAVAASTPGVTGAEPVETSSVLYNGQTYVAWGLGAHPLYSYRLSSGRWFTAAEAAARAGPAVTPVVLGPGVAHLTDARIGQILTLTMAAGPVRARVIGIDAGEPNAGDTVYFPLQALEALDGGPGTADSIWVSTASSGHAAIDQATTAAAARLAAAGYTVSTTEIYVTEAQITASDKSILAIVEILGTLVVAIMLMGLVSALSMGVIERTREVGILRCVGARARHIRRVFSAEAVVLAVIGWALGILLGWLIYEGLVTLLLHGAAFSLPQDFPPAIPLITLAGVLVLTLLVIRGPLRRATRIRPGTALRYQ